MADTPQDRKPTQAELKKQNEAMASFLSAGLDFTPFTIDAGDGIEWRFLSDPRPADIERLNRAQMAIQDAERTGGDIAAGFEQLINAIRELLIDDEQRAQFPMPNYGVRALMWFTGNLTRGKTGLPTLPA